MKEPLIVRSAPLFSARRAATMRWIGTFRPTYRWFDRAGSRLGKGCCLFNPHRILSAVQFNEFYWKCQVLDVRRSASVGYVHCLSALPIKSSALWDGFLATLKLPVTRVESKGKRRQDGRLVDRARSAFAQGPCRGASRLRPRKKWPGKQSGPERKIPGPGFLPSSGKPFQIGKFHASTSRTPSLQRSKMASWMDRGVSEAVGVNIVSGRVD
jgi:hypothetical protein